MESFPDRNVEPSGEVLSVSPKPGFSQPGDDAQEKRTLKDWQNRYDNSLIREESANKPPSRSSNRNGERDYSVFCMFIFRLSFSSITFLDAYSQLQKRV